MKYIILLFFILSLFSSASEIEKMKEELKTAKDTSKVKILIELTRHYLVNEPNLSYEYVSQALKMSNELSYLWGQEKALSNLSTYYRNIGELEKAKESAEKILTLKNAMYSPEAVFDYNFAIAQIKRIENNPDEEYQYYINALENSDKYKYAKGIAHSHRSMADFWSRKGEFDSSNFHIAKAIKIFKDLDMLNEIAGSYNTMATTYARNNELDSSEATFLKALEINLKLNNKNDIADNYSNLALVNYFKNYKEKFISYSQNALDIYEKINNKVGMAAKYSDISIVYSELENFSKAIEFAKKSISINKQIGNPQGLANAYNNIGNYYKEIDSLSLAIDYYNKAIEVADKINLLDIKPQILFNLGVLFKKQNDLKKAEVNYKLAEKLTLELQMSNMNSQLAYIYTNLADLYKDSKRLGLAIDYLIKAEELAKQENLSNVKVNIYDNYAQVYDSLDNYTLAYKFHKLFTNLKDSLNNVEKQKIISELNTKYETEKKEKENELLLAQNEINISEKKALQIRTYSLIIGIILVIILAIILYNRYRLKQKSNLILEKQKQEITEQKQIVDRQNEEIMSSIRYAEKIQMAILPFEKELKDNFKEHFVLFRPKDIVSGDFYWFAEQNGNRYIASVDCTGHGIPGAMLSLIGNMLLNEAVTLKENILPSEILNFLDDRIKFILNQYGDDVETQDGMDLNLVMISDNQVVFSGARRPLFVYTDKLLTYKGTRMSIGGKQRGRVSGFEDEFIEYVPDMKIYLFTDGITDQMGANNKKFGTNNIKDFIETHHNKDMKEQITIINMLFDEHTANEEQRDDITLIGVKI
jgi:serine phosphatase RsbU (regulator of sigma subunit)